jgi:hypothetical protein
MLAFVLLGAACLAGCDRKPINKLVDPTLNNTTGNWSGRWVIYDDELRTGGGVSTFTTFNGVDLDFDSRETPYSGSTCIKFFWNGGEVTPYSPPGSLSEYTWTGFGLIVAVKTEDYDRYSKDFSASGFDKLTFRARGSLNNGVVLRVEGPQLGAQTPAGFWEGAITDQWQQYTVNLNPQTTINAYLNIILKYSGAVRGNGDGLH